MSMNIESFINRHIGPQADDKAEMLASLGFDSIDALMDAIIPDQIRLQQGLALDGEMSEAAALAELKAIAGKNQVKRSLIGQGYYGTLLPNVILRNLLENPAWYTAYTPYQPEISQGRLEAILNFQTLITDLTGMDLANASLLDEGTAAAEAMTLAQRMSKSKGRTLLVDEQCLPQTIEVLRTRAEPLDIEIKVVNPFETDFEDAFGIILQYPGANGEVQDFTSVIEGIHAVKGLAVVAADLLSLVMLKTPAEMGADVVIGNSQRFGVPFGFGGPHAAYMATRESYKRSLPGRLVGVSQDAQGKPAYRLALQTREQHIRREKATSNICTAQVLLANIASMYAVYHGPEGLKRIAANIHGATEQLATALTNAGFTIANGKRFDTLTVVTGEQTAAIHARAVEGGYNLRHIDENTLGVSLDETIIDADLADIFAFFAPETAVDFNAIEATCSLNGIQREGDFLTHPVFNSHRSETDLLRYMRSLADKDLALDRTMIPLGSCTMKLNATAEMIPITWPEFSNIHPFAPADQTLGYQEMLQQLEGMLCEATGYDAMSLQPNSGAQGEYAGLLAIKAYHESRGEGQRNICLIPSSAHGTNPASAQMCGMKVVVTKCDDQGNVDLDDLRAKAEQHSDNLAALMVTYPSTHGVFETQITEVCDLIHEHGGQVYIDGANFNAMVGLCKPGKFGGDVSHLNLHKTFCIPHGGGGPGVGPIGVGSHLEPFLPKTDVNADKPVGLVSAAPYGSASILPITWMYVRMMGGDGLRQATMNAILNANYLTNALKQAYPVLYTGARGFVAHECILDIRPITDQTGVSVDDIAKRLIDFGFHAPTMSFPVAGTLMIEPTESESKAELDRFIEAMLAIKEEIDRIASGEWSLDDSPLHNAPHTAEVLVSDQWAHAYSRETAAYPVASLRRNKYWVPVGRVDNVFGDRNLVCACPPLSAYED